MLFHAQHTKLISFPRIPDPPDEIQAHALHKRRWVPWVSDLWLIFEDYHRYLLLQTHLTLTGYHKCKLSTFNKMTPTRMLMMMGFFSPSSHKIKCLVTLKKLIVMMENERSIMASSRRARGDNKVMDRKSRNGGMFANWRRRAFGIDVTLIVQL